MRTRMVVVGVLCLSGAVSARASEPFGTAPAADARLAPETETSVPASAESAPRAKVKDKDTAKEAGAAEAEAAARRLGITSAELAEFARLGLTEPEIAAQVRDGKRTARQVLTEMAVIADAAKAVAEANLRVYKLPAAQQAAERDRLLRSAVAKLRRDYRTTRDDLRRILSGTSLLTEEETRRHLGPGLFRTDELRRVFFSPAAPADTPPTAK